MLAGRVQFFTESVIREMTRLANQFGAVNLGQGMPDFETPQELKEAACQAIRDGYNQYAITWGAPVLRKAIAEKVRRFNGIPCDPDENVTVCCGATECMMATMLALVDPGDEVVIFQPFYENYGPDALLSGAKPVWVSLRPPDWRIDFDELRAAFSPRTRAIILNTPNNPTGKVFTRPELEFIAGLCREFDAYALADEIYEYIIYTDQPHVSIGSLPGMAERTVTISGLSKTFSITGWRLGYAVAPPDLTSAITLVNDLYYVCAPTPLQLGAAAGFDAPRAYFDELQSGYERKRDRICAALREAGLAPIVPQGAYYVLADCSGLGFSKARDAAMHVLEQRRVASVPGSAFYRGETGEKLLRFCFAKDDAVLEEACQKLRAL